MLGKPQASLASRHPAAWKAMTAIPAGQVELGDGLWTWSTVYPLKQESGGATPSIPAWLVVGHLGPQRLDLIRQEAWPAVLNVAVLVLSVFAFLSAWLARALIGRYLAVADGVRAHADAENAKRMCEVLERFHLVVEANANGLLVVNQRGRIVMANPALERMFGHPSGSLVGKPMEVLLPEALRHGHAALRDGYLANPASRPMGLGRELTGQRLDGSQFPVEISLSPFTENGQLLVDAVVVDITARKQAENRLRQREAHLAMLVDSHPEGLLVVDGTGRIEIANPAAEALLGYERGELAGLEAADLLHEGDGQGHPLLDPAPPRGEHSLLGRHKDGSTVKLSVNLARFSDGGQAYTQATLRPRSG
ncbi:MAG: PAS domain S-box protein [Pseudomonadota bacterium]